jgi:hypothetical protein
MRATLLALALLAAGEEPLSVALAPAVPEGGVAVGYGAARPIAVETSVPRFLMEVPALRARDACFARLSLGGAEGGPFYLALDRSEGGTHHDRLYIDRNRDLDLTNDGDPLAAVVRSGPEERRLVEFPPFDLAVRYEIEGTVASETYRGAIFYEGGGDRPPTTLYFERDGWREGTAKLDGIEYRIAVVDDDSDGLFTTSDSWVFQPADAPREGMLSDLRTRAIGYPCWIAGQKRVVEIVTLDRAGRTAALRVADATESERDFFVRVRSKSLTPEERELRIDPLRPRARPDQKVAWLQGKELQYALDIAAKVRKRVLVEFTAPDCVWCDRMERLTFRDREVYELTRQLVCIRLPYVPGMGDSARFGVQGTPTYLVLDAAGKEVARQAGFLEPTRFASFLEKAVR